MLTRVNVNDIVKLSNQRGETTMKEATANVTFKSALTEAIASALRSCQKNVTLKCPGRFFLIQNIDNEFLFHDFLGDPGIFGRFGPEAITIVFHHITDEHYASSWINHFNEIFQIVFRQRSGTYN